MNIRAARAGDLDAVEALLRDAKLPLDGVRDFFPDSYAVAERGNEIIGAIGIEHYGGHGLLRSAVVVETARGTGVGNQLVQERLQWSRDQDLRDLFLLTTTAPVFFEKLGFVRTEREAVPAEVQRAPEFASICPSTAVVMRLPL